MKPRTNRPLQAMPLLMTVVFYLSMSAAHFSHAHSGGLNKEGCHAGSKPYHCHHQSGQIDDNPQKPTSMLSGVVTHVRDGDTIVVNDVPIRLAGLDCPEKGTKDGDQASSVMTKLKNKNIQCELTGAKTFDRLVGYCSLNGNDLGTYMIENSACAVWQKYDVWNRY